MAITRAQQARQMLKDGNFVMQGGVKNYLGKQETVSNVPLKWQSGPDKPSTELAYITKAEKDLLLKKDIHGSLKDGPNEGPEGIMSLDSQGDRGTYGDTGQSYGDRQTDDTSPEVGDRGGGYQDSGYEDRRKAREKNSKKIEDEFKKDARATRKEMRKKLSDDKKRRQARVLGILSRAENYVDPITGETVPLNEFGLTDEERAELLSVSNISGIGPKTELQKSLMDNLLEKSDKFSGANVETFKERFDTPDMPGLLGMGLKLFEGPLKKGSRKTKDFFTDDVLGAGKFTYKGQEVTPGLFEALSPAEMQEVYGNYMDRRMGGDIDAYGNPIMRQDDERTRSNITYNTKNG
jgi:hypothetical protein